MTVSFRLDPESARRLDALVAMSGLTKQDYITSRLLDERVAAVPSSRLERRLRGAMASVYAELLRAKEEGRAVGADVAWASRALAETYAGLAAEAPMPDLEEAVLRLERDPKILRGA